MIGHGSFGAVFLAKVVETDDVVAIKKVLQDKRFKNRELQIMRQIAKQPHPYVVALRHHFISKGSKSDDVYLNLVLEYIPETVYSVAKHYNRAKESVPLFSVRLYMYQLCRSLAHIHGMGICHRSVLCNPSSCKSISFSLPPTPPLLKHAHIHTITLFLTCTFFRSAFISPSFQHIQFQRHQATESARGPC